MTAKGDTIRTDAMVQAILSRLREGEPLAQICRDEGMCNAETWRNWCHADADLAFAYARAREDGEDAIAAEAMKILDEEVERFATEHGDRMDPAHVQDKRLRVEGRLKLLAKWNPKRWGEKVEHDVNGALTVTIASDVAKIG